MSPFHIGIEPVIGRPALVLVLQALLRGLRPLTILLYDALRPELQIRVDKTRRQSALSRRM